MATHESIDAERWVPIPGYEGYYEVSDRGRIRGVDRIDGSGRRWPGRILRPSTAGPYDSVGLWRDGQQKQMKIHTAVLTSFVGPRPERMEGCHNDGNSKNNQLSNLRWDTASENKLDTVRHGTHRWSRRRTSRLADKNSL